MEQITMVYLYRIIYNILIDLVFAYTERNLIDYKI